MARRMLRIVLHLLDHEDLFVPPSLLDNPEPDALRGHYAALWRPMLVKWRNAGAIRQAFAADAPLERWRVMLNEIYKLNLSSTSPQVDVEQIV